MPLDRDAIVSLGTRLPPSLGVLGRLQSLLGDRDADLSDIVELVRIDPALTFQIIKLANSALYGLRNRCESLEDAVAHVGFGDIHQIVGLAVSRQTFQGELLAYEIAGGRLWENAVAVGALNAGFAELAGADGRAAYATGLLRNIGKVVLNNFAPHVRFPGEAVAPDVFLWEKAQHGLDAPEVAAVLLEHWRFAPEMVRTVARHRSLGGDDDGSAARLHVACAVAASWGCALPGETCGWRRDEALLARAGIAADQFEAAVEAARKRFVEYCLIEWSRAA